MSIITCFRLNEGGLNCNHICCLCLTPSIESQLSCNHEKFFTSNNMFFANVQMRYLKTNAKFSSNYSRLLPEPRFLCDLHKTYFFTYFFNFLKNNIFSYFEGKITYFALFPLKISIFWGYFNQK